MSAPRHRSTEGGVAARALAPLARAWADRAEAPRPSEWIAIEEALAVREDRAAGARARAALWRRGALAGAAAALAVVGATMLLRARTDGGQASDTAAGGGRALTFVVADAPAGGGAGAAAASDVQATSAPARVAFSDGSEVVLERGTHASVVGTTARGARVRLDGGRARFSVTHRAATEWAADAGPFTVVVHGTVFDLDWSSARGALAVDLLSGNVAVTGPFPGGAVALKAGERLTADANGRFHVVAIAQPARPGGGGAATDEAAASARAATVESAGVGASGDEHDRDRGDARRSHGGARGTAAAHRLALAEVAAGWPAEVASGSFETVLAEANAAGFERSLAEVPAAALAALADAARYGRRADLARKALLAERRRFAGSPAARDAAFLIGRLAEDSGHDAAEAVLWYDRCLAESAGGRGTYASEALGRKMLALDRLDARARAREAAERYLRDFPAGAYQARAERIRAR